MENPKLKTASSLFAALAIALAFLTSLSGPGAEQPNSETEPPPPLEELIPSGERVDIEKTLLVLFDDVEEMTMEQYLFGVVAAEMPASFELEALKAQAIAARTNAMYYINADDNEQHPGANVCTDPSCCTAFSSDDLLRRRWGPDYVRYINRIISAVIGTDGIYMSYENEPIPAVFHSSSSGKTETSGNVWLADLPFLLSVDSPETEREVPNYITTVQIDRDDFAETILNAYPDAVFTDNEQWIADITHTESGRVLEIVIGGVSVKGTELRTIFNLRSTAITFEFTDSNIYITTTGFGHGVGMSQYGANSMASAGKNCIDILSHYYQGIEFIRP